MTRDDIIKMAMEAGGTVMACYSPDLERFAALVAAAEREAILKMSSEQWFKTQADFESAIRARGQG